METIALDALRFGHEADPPMNARIIGRSEEVEALAASIQAHGLIQALTVAEQAGVHYVVDGNRRLAALKLLAKEGKVTGDHPVRVDLGGGTGLEVSLAANLMRVPMHEADTYTTFRDLAAGGMTEDDIAGRFGIEKKRVRRMLALGALAPVIINAWREGKLNGYIVRAFTLAPDLTTQEKVFADLDKRGRLHEHSVRLEFGAAEDLRKELKLVGLDAYRAAGGHVIEDLFGEYHNVTDPGLMRALAEAKLDGVAETLLADGWAWAARSEALPSNWRWGWTTLAPEDVAPTKEEAARLKKLKKQIDTDNKAKAELDALAEVIRLRGYTDAVKLKSGCVIVTSYSGDVTIKYGVVKPEPAKAKAAAGNAADGAAEDEQVAISAALKARLFEQMTFAAQQALLSDPTVALAAMVASMTTSGHHGQPVSVTFTQHGLKSDEAYDVVFARCLAMGDQELMAAFAAALAPMVDMRVTYSKGKKPAVDALIDALDLSSAHEQSALGIALQEHFDAGDYFASAPKSATLAAIREAVGEAEATRMASAKKKELVAFALERVVGTGWLPPELRTPSYSGPGEIEAKAA